MCSAPTALRCRPPHLPILPGKKALESSSPVPARPLIWGGVLAAYTTLPIIGVPIKSSTLDGMDALLSTVQMPSGIPVASVAIDGAANAAILAAEILSISEPALEEKLKAMRAKMTQSVLEKDEKVSAAY